MIQLNDTTYGIPGLGDRMTAPVITLGGKDPKKFAPNLNIGFDFGGGEEYFDNLNRTDKIITGKSEIKHDGKIVSIIEGSDIDEIYTDDQGRMKWDVVFEKCPESFVLEWRRTCSPGLTAYYQPALTEEEIREGAYRPDDVIGSYAIYCDRAHNWIRPLNRKKEIPADWRAQRAAGAELGDLNISAYREYKTGKVAHRYRPFVIDADGKTAWCSLLIICNVERVTLPEDFMRGAKYPVRLDPDFGYTSIGSSDMNGGRDATGSLYGNYTAASGDVITGISAACRTTAESGTLPVAPYTVSNGTFENRLGDIANITVTDTSNNWNSVGGLSRSMTDGLVYGPAFGGGTSARIAFDSSGTNYLDTDTYDPTLPTSWATAYSMKSGYIASIYVTYTESSGGHPTASRFRGMDRNNNVRYA
jgi:hypothetical protein